MSEGSWGFLGEEVNFDRAKYAIIPCPYESTQTGRKGSSEGALSIIKASRLLENYNYEFDFNVKDLIYTFPPLALSVSPERAIEEIYLNLEDVINKGKTPIIIGGEHTVALGANKINADFIVFDAHADFYDSYNGEKFSHACVSRRLSENHKVIIIGVRALSLEEKEYLERNRNVKVYYIDNLDAIDLDFVQTNVWLSIDMDVFDPSIAPNVAVPVHHGMDYNAFRKIIKRIMSIKNVIGMDLSEVIPNENLTAELLASKCILDIISLKELSTIK